MMQIMKANKQPLRRAYILRCNCQTEWIDRNFFLWVWCTARLKSDVKLTTQDRNMGGSRWKFSSSPPPTLVFISIQVYCEGWSLIDADSVIIEYQSDFVWATGRLMSPDRGFGTSRLLHCSHMTVSANSEDSWKRFCLSTTRLVTLVFRRRI